mgnify:CR=1 FL=1
MDERVIAVEWFMKGVDLKGTDLFFSFSFLGN